MGLRRGGVGSQGTEPPLGDSFPRMGQPLRHLPACAGAWFWVFSSQSCGKDAVLWVFRNLSFSVDRQREL